MAATCSIRHTRVAGAAFLATRRLHQEQIHIKLKARVVGWLILAQVSARDRQSPVLDPALARFTSPDPANAGADLYNPQSWNGYAYVNNNPLALVDPSGMEEVTIGINDCYSAQFDSLCGGGNDGDIWGGGVYFPFPTGGGGGGNGGTKSGLKSRHHSGDQHAPSSEFVPGRRNVGIAAGDGHSGILGRSHHWLRLWSLFWRHWADWLSSGGRARRHNGGSMRD